MLTLPAIVDLNEELAREQQDTVIPHNGIVFHISTANVWTSSGPVSCFMGSLSPSKECCNIKQTKQARKGVEREGNASSNLNLKSFGAMYVPLNTSHEIST